MKLGAECGAAVNMFRDPFGQFCLGHRAGFGRNNFTAFEKQQRWDSRDTVLHSEVHVLGDVDFSYFGVSVVIGCQFINDWTQSFARASAFGIEIYQYRSFRTEHVGFESIGCEFCCHVYSPLSGSPTWQS